MTEHSRTSQLATLIIKSIGASFLLLMLAACGQDAAPTLSFFIHGGLICFLKLVKDLFHILRKSSHCHKISFGFSTAQSQFKLLQAMKILLKFRHCKVATKFEKNSHLFSKLLINIKKIGNFFPSTYLEILLFTISVLARGHE
jgi:hypothetical protein